jgi:hypothetical protein
VKALFLVVLVLCAPSYAQSADAPIAVVGQPLAPDPAKPCAAKSGDVVLTPEEAVKLGKRLADAEGKLSVYEKVNPLPWWGALLIGVVAAGAGVAVTVGIYEGTRKP